MNTHTEAPQACSAIWEVGHWVPREAGGYDFRADRLLATSWSDAAGQAKRLKLERVEYLRRLEEEEGK